MKYPIYGSGSYIGGRPGRAPPLMEKIENIIITRDTTPSPPHGLGKSQIWRPPSWDFLDEPLYGHNLTHVFNSSCAGVAHPLYRLIS